ncbi:MAG: hypothetical protein KAT66_03105 [Candidatus Lokiarchaeota archaeon]|nr:hypothetical protein [Candidatus Lokiarchaeota archaeon]
MEIEKIRETSWKIQLKNKDQNIEITSVEISGEVRIIRLALLNKDKSIRVEMKKEEFFNLLSLISAFKDVVIGEEAFVMGEELNLIESRTQQTHDLSTENEDIYLINSETSEKNLEKEDTEELNPEEWDPW